MFPDTALCNAYMSPQFGVTNFNAPSATVLAVSKETAQFDSTQAAACLNALSNLGCGEDFLKEPSIPTSCAAVFSGSVSESRRMHRRRGMRERDHVRCRVDCDV